MSNEKIVGHKSLSDGAGGYRHEPLYESEAAEIMQRIEAAEARRIELMPDEESARKLFHDAWSRLKDFGWNEAIYCPKDGSPFDVIECGSTGTHRCTYQGEWPSGRWWIESSGDIWPSRPVLFRSLAARTAAAAAEQATGAEPQGDAK